MVAALDVRKILKGIEALSGVIDDLGDDADLFENGLDSFGSVQLMLALENAYDIEFPDHLLNRRSFSSIRIIVDTVASLGVRLAA